MSEVGNGSHPVRGGGKEALVDATIEILSEDGLAGVTYRSVAERAGVTHGLVRHHFKSLTGLIQTAVTEWAENSRGATLLEPGTGKLSDLAADLPADVQANAVGHVVMYELAMSAARSSDLRDELRETYRGYVDAVTRELERAGFGDTTTRLGRVAFAAIDGLVIQQLILDEPGKLDEGLSTLRSVLALVREHKDTLA